MTQQLFITARERLNPRWQEAFDKADYCSHGAFSQQRLASKHSGICWLDISLLAVDERLPVIHWSEPG